MSRLKDGTRWTEFARGQRQQYLATPFYVARPHVLADKFAAGHFGDSFDLLLCVHRDSLANEFDGSFLIGFIRKEIPDDSRFSLGIESRDSDIPTCCHSSTMRRDRHRSTAAARGVRIVTSCDRRSWSYRKLE